MENKESLFIMGVVSIVAVFGIVMLTMGLSANSGATSSYADNVGQAAKSKIIREPFCGNGILEAGEQCESNVPFSMSCTDLGYAGGTLSCDYSTCQYDTSGCYLSLCGNGVIEGTEECDGNNLGGLTCTDFGSFTGGTLACYPPGSTNECRFDTSNCNLGYVNATIQYHYFQIYGSKYYNLQSMNYYYNLGIYSGMVTTPSANSQITASCYSYDYATGNSVSLYTSAYGRTRDEYPELDAYGSTNGGVNFENVEASCTSMAYIQDGPQSTLQKTFNNGGVSYPTLNAGAIYRNTLTDQYFVYFDATNYNGGICKLAYFIDTQSSNQLIYLEQDLPDCPTQVSYLAPIPFNESLVPGEQVYLSITLRPTMANENYVYTSGSGSFYFDSNAKTVTVAGQTLTPLVSQKVTDTLQNTLNQNTDELIVKQIKETDTTLIARR